MHWGAFCSPDVVSFNSRVAWLLAEKRDIVKERKKETLTFTCLTDCRRRMISSALKYN